MPTQPTKRKTETPDDVVARIRFAFDTLRIPKARQRFDEILAAPKQDLTRIEWLHEILDLQVRSRIESRIERRIRESKLPERKTLAAFDFDFQSKLDKDLVLELGTLAFLDQGRNLLLAGWSGTGKSHIAMAIALSACAANRRVRYTTNADMLTTLNASLAADTLPKTVKRYTLPELLLIDEVGLEQVERRIANRAGLMQKVLIPRHNERRSTIITSNIPWKEWGDYLGDQLGAAAILDRLIHHSHVIVIEGPSWREHEHKQDVETARRRSGRRKRAKKKPAKDET